MNLVVSLLIHLEDTECLITSDNLNRKGLREELLDIGNSLVLAGSKKRAKIHIHTNNPASIFSICEQFGDVSGQKADDMVHQKDSMHGTKINDVAIITDSGADFNEEDLDIILKHDLWWNATTAIRYGFVDQIYYGEED